MRAVVHDRYGPSDARQAAVVQEIHALIKSGRCRPVVDRKCPPKDILDAAR